MDRKKILNKQIKWDIWIKLITNLIYYFDTPFFQIVFLIRLKHLWFISNEIEEYF